ncbi:hypothetical protein ONZ45_g6975 [Pleurotus djamor]|nr:hypothetical protein ONZ45_g6975 [Pleurotus djamor]
MTSPTKIQKRPLESEDENITDDKSPQLSKKPRPSIRGSSSRHSILNEDGTTKDDRANSSPNHAESSRTISQIPFPIALGDHILLALGGLHWRGRLSFENLVVFGDSYSQNEGEETWVDHTERLVDIAPQNVYNYAFPGATAEHDFSTQLSQFLNTSTRLLENETTYVIFFGINDCGSTDVDDLEAIVEGIFDGIHELYDKSHARNFILFDVPPVDRSPQAIDAESSPTISDRISAWNELLLAHAEAFARSTRAATILVFSTHHVLTEVLDDPLEYDFSEDDVENEGGGIWVDDLHLTGGVHGILAKVLVKSVLGESSR